MARLVVGTMSGTSLDGLDACMVEIKGEGMAMSPIISKGVSRAFPTDMAQRLRRLAEREAFTAEEIVLLTNEFSTFHVDVVRELLEGLTTSPDLIAVHGQTVYHAPPFNTWQLINPTIIAHALQTRVVFDMRAADLAAGGQGAPITPIADYLLFRGAELQTSEARVVVNLGGFCNFTYLKGGQVEGTAGRDVCACNQIIDAAARTFLGRQYDEDGRAALQGAVDLHTKEATKSFLSEQLMLRKSLGTQHDPASFISHLAAHQTGSSNDVLRSCCAAVAEVIVAAVAEEQGAGGVRVTSMVLAGGGARNRCLVAFLHEAASQLLGGCCSVVSSGEFGVDVEFREASEMAILGALCEDGVPITLPSITGCSELVVSGLWALPTRPKTKTSVAAAPSSASVITFIEAMSECPHDRGGVLTEQRNANSASLHSDSVEGIVCIMQQEDEAVIEACRTARPALVALIEDIVSRYSAGGRLVYLGCGTSGRLGVLDAAECGPTFNVEAGRVLGIIAGGDAALRKSSEGAEDDPDGAIRDLHGLFLGRLDTVVGIAAGGSTPYVINGLRHVASSPAESRPLTALISCSPLPGDLLAEAFIQHPVVLAVGPEVLTGSTRMKAGTATKMALNQISTALFVREGKVFSNLMVDLRATNVKLVDRAIRIIRCVCPSLDRESSFSVLKRAQGSCKVALLLALRPELSVEDAEAALDKARGNVAAAISVFKDESL